MAEQSTGAGVEPASIPAAETEPPKRWRPYQAWLIFVLVLVAVCNAMDRGIVGLLQEPIKVDLGLSDAELGIITGPAFGILYGVFGLPVARLAERFNRPNLLAAVIAFWSSMTALCGMAGNFIQMVVFRSLVGIGESGANPISHSLVGDEFPVRQRGFAMSVLSSAIPLASIVTPLTLGIVAHHFGWRTAFFVAAIPGLIVALLVKFTVREGRLTDKNRPKPSPFNSDMKWFLKSWPFVCIWFASAFNALGIIGTGGFTTSFLIRNRGLELDEVGIMVGAFGIAGLIGTFAGGYIADKFGDAQGRSYVLVPCAGAILSFVSFMISYRVEVLAGALFGLFVANIATDLKNGPNYAAVINVAPPQMRATASALLFLAATVLGGSMGPLVVGIFSDAAASGAFAMGDYHALCLGKANTRSTDPEILSACAAASAAGLRTALGYLPITFLVSAAFFWLSSLKMKISEQ